jgi:hypothetical protein
MVPHALLQFDKLNITPSRKKENLFPVHYCTLEQESAANIRVPCALSAPGHFFTLARRKSAGNSSGTLEIIVLYC